jgi:SAM-dependent methyltransferase
MVYSTKAPDAVSWFRPHLEASLALIERVAADRTAPVIDVGGGASTLVDDLVARGYGNITVLDISGSALEVSRMRLGLEADRVHWLSADITEAGLLPHSYDVWHDRAVFHFLTAKEQRVAYVEKVADALKLDGHVIIGTFGREGPAKCSGLDVVRYDGESLQREFGERFHLVDSFEELHNTPFGTKQQFLYCCLRMS